MPSGRDFRLDEKQLGWSNDSGILFFSRRICLKQKSAQTFRSSALEWGKSLKWNWNGVFRTLNKRPVDFQRIIQNIEHVVFRWTFWICLKNLQVRMTSSEVLSEWHCLEAKRSIAENVIQWPFEPPKENQSKDHASGFTNDDNTVLIDNNDIGQQTVTESDIFCCRPILNNDP